MDKFLVVSCSQTKRQSSGLLPAIERYDGPAYRVIRRALAGERSRLPQVFVLSAEYGLIPGHQPIPYYNRVIDLGRAKELRPQVLAELQQITETSPASELFLCLTRRYLPAIEGIESICPQSMVIKQGQRCRGRMLADLHAWLHAKRDEGEACGSPRKRDKAVFRGKVVSLSCEEVIEIARNLDEIHESQVYWHVSVDDRKVGIKRLMNAITGVPVSEFHTDAARRLLVSLGVPVSGD